MSASGQIRVTLSYVVPVDLTTPENREAWGNAETVAEARENYETWLHDGTLDIMLELGTFDNEITEVTTER